MPRVTTPPPKPARRPPRPPRPRRPSVSQTLGEPRDVKDRPRGWKLALRRQRRRIRPVLYGLGTLGALATIAFIVHASSHEATLISTRQRFGALGAALGLRIADIRIEGRDTTPAPLVEAAIGVTRGDPLLGFSVEAARARLTTIASIQDATVERRWPGTILVSLTERHAYAIWQSHGRFTLIDHDGAILADQDPRLERDLPLIVGAGAPPHAAELLDAIATHPEIRSHLVAAVRVSDRRWNLRMTSGADVLLPQDNQQAALTRLDALQKDHRLLDRKLQVVDLRLPNRLTLRPDTAALPAPTQDPFNPDPKPADPPPPRRYGPRPPRMTHPNPQGVAR